MVTYAPLLFIHQIDIFFYNFCRTFGTALQHFLSDIHQKCPIVRQVRRISTPLPVAFIRNYRMIILEKKNLSQVCNIN